MHTDRRRIPFVKHLLNENGGVNPQHGNLDFSGVGNAVDFILLPGLTEVFQIDILSIQILDRSITMAKYGGVTIDPLTFIGVDVSVKVYTDTIGGAKQELYKLVTIEEKITTNGEMLAVFADNAAPIVTPGAGDSLLLASHRFFEKDMDFTLDGRKGEFLAVTLNDDFSSLSKHQFHAQGRIISHEYNRDGKKFNP